MCGKVVGGNVYSGAGDCVVVSVVDIVGDGVVDDLGDNVNGGEDNNGGDIMGDSVVEGVGDGVGNNVEDIVVGIVGIDVLSLFLKSVDST